MELDKRVLAILACPNCKSNLKYNKQSNELICKADAIAFPIVKGIPVMMIESARPLSTDEKLNK